MRHTKGLRIDVDCGEGEIALPAWFMESDPLFRLDVLSDWVDGLSALYDAAGDEFSAEFERMGGGWVAKDE